MECTIVRLRWLLALAVLFSTSSHFASADNTDPCRENSYVSQIQNNVVGAQVGIFNNLTTMPQVVQGLYFFTLYCLNLTTSPYVVNAYVCLTNSDFYLIGNCANQISLDYCENAGTHFFAMVRNKYVFGDTKRRVFAVNDSTLHINPATGLIAVEPFADDCNLRGFVVNPDAWSSLHFIISYPAYSALGAVVGRTYSVIASGGVIAADQATYEPCGVCLSNSYAVPSAISLANFDLSPYYYASTMEDIEKGISLIASVVKTISDPTMATLYVAYDNDNFMMIKNCQIIATSDAICANSPTPYTAWICNSAVFRDDKRHVFPISSDWKMEFQQIGVETTSYIATQQSYFLVLEGWTDPYTFGSGGYGRSYVSPFRFGVAASDIVLSTYGCSRTVSAASSLVPLRANALLCIVVILLHLVVY